MAIEKRFIHFKKFSDFNSKKLSANEANTQYTVGIGGEIQTGSPDVLYQSYVWIKDTQQQWTHGQIYNGSASLVNETDPIFSASPAANITEDQIIKWDNDHEFVQDLDKDISKLYDDLGGKQDTISDLSNIRSGASNGATAVQPSELATVATSGNYNDLSNKPTIPSAVTESTVSGWGFTKNTGTISQIKINGSTVTRQTDGVMDIGSYQVPLVSGTNIKTINNTSILGKGNIAIDANIQAVDTQETLDDVETNTYVKYVAQTLTDEQKAQVRENIGVVEGGKEIIANKQGIDSIFVFANDSDNGPLEPNKIYVSPFTVTFGIIIENIIPPTDLYAEYTIIFKTGGGANYEGTLMLPSYVLWANGTIPTLEAQTNYELSISATKIDDEYVYKAVLVPFKSV